MATIFLGQKSSLTSRIKVLKWTILSSCHQTSNVWIIPKRSELVRSLILNYSTFFLELVLYWLILNIDSLLMWQFLSLFRSIKCWIILSNKKKFENRNKDGILQSDAQEKKKKFKCNLDYEKSRFCFLATRSF